jgi:hypothetical protein
MMSFLPSTILFGSLSSLILFSYLLEKKTEYILLVLFATFISQSFSSWLLFFFSAIFYHDVSQILVLCIAHILSIALLTLLNAAVIFKFR